MLFRSSLTELMASSTSMSSIINSLIGFQAGFFAAIVASMAMKKLKQPQGYPVCAKLMTSLGWPARAPTEASSSLPAKTEKMQQNPVKHFLHVFELNSYEINIFAAFVFLLGWKAVRGLVATESVIRDRTVTGVQTCALPIFFD